MAIYVNDKRVNKSECCNPPTKTMRRTETNVSVSCSVGESSPFPTVNWELEFAAQSNEKSSIRKHQGIELQRLSKEIYIGLSSGTRWKYNVKCIVSSPDPRTGEVKKHEMCVRLLPEKIMQAPSILWYVGSAVVITAMIAMMSFIFTTPALEKQGVQFTWMKLSAACSATFALLLTIGLASSHKVLVSAYNLSNDELSGIHTVLVTSYVAPAGICTALCRLFGNVLALRLFNLRAEQTEQVYRVEEGRCMGMIHFIFGMLSGPGTMYMFRGMANFLKLGSESSIDGEHNQRTTPEYAVPHHHVRGFLRLDTFGCLVALVNMFAFNFTASTRTVIEPPATYIMEGNAIHSIIIYICLGVCVIVSSDVYFIMHFGRNRFHRNKVFCTRSWRLYLPWLPEQSIQTRKNSSSKPEECPLEDVPNNRNPEQGERAGN